MEYETATLVTPIKIGNEEVKELKLRKPLVGDLRGLKTMDILQMDVTAHGTLVPRISPDLTKALFDNLSAQNLTAIQSVVVGFFLDMDV